MLNHGKRIQALKRRETYITQEELDKRDEALSVDYEEHNYDYVLKNDYREETVNDAISTIQKELDSEQKQGKSDSQERKNFLNQLSNNGEHRNLPPVVDLNGKNNTTKKIIEK